MTAAPIPGTNSAASSPDHSALPLSTMWRGGRGVKPNKPKQGGSSHDRAHRTSRQIDHRLPVPRRNSRRRRVAGPSRTPFRSVRTAFWWSTPPAATAVATTTSASSTSYGPGRSTAPSSPNAWSPPPATIGSRSATAPTTCSKMAIPPPLACPAVPSSAASPLRKRQPVCHQVALPGPLSRSRHRHPGLESRHAGPHGAHPPRRLDSIPPQRRR